ncbi:Dynein regulatory complex protein like protein [Aduncisulcus paluster]|uniref:Dynein regulatory complex subunit 2 n=1 Tax=Aduncisulcus paluster TaxID=2918883 RepID=A0ABQ5KPE7_9EUKA|nr:Dynein regulatory complex protein like protein [Aduncisulcus paluster]
MDQKRRLEMLKLAEEEERMARINKAKVSERWRSVLREVKKEDLVEELELLSQSYERQLDTKDGVIRLLNSYLELADEQHKREVRQQVSTLDEIALLGKRHLSKLQSEFDSSSAALKEEYKKEMEEMERRHLYQVRTQAAIIQALKAEQSRKEKSLKDDQEAQLSALHSSSRETINIMRLTLKARQDQLKEHFKESHAAYVAATEQRSRNYKALRNNDQRKSADITEQAKKLKKLQASLAKWRAKLSSTEAEYAGRNATLREEKAGVTRHFSSLKRMMVHMREEERKRLARLVLKTKEVEKKLESQKSQGERVLRLAQLCMKLETDYERIRPFASHIESIELKDEIDAEREEELKHRKEEEEMEGEKAEVDKEIKEVITSAEGLRPFYRRMNRVLMDRLALERQQAALREENRLLREALQEFLDGLTINDHTFDQENPIMVVEGFDSPTLIHEGNAFCCPIPRDSTNITNPMCSTIEAVNTTKEVGDKDYDQTYDAQCMIKGGNSYEEYTYISLPFSSSYIKGAYICIGGESTSHLIFSLSSSTGENMSKKFEFPELETCRWFFLSFDISDVILCKITGKGRGEEFFRIESLFFISREETSEEIKAREAKEKLWAEAPIVKPEFVKEGDNNRLSRGENNIPIPRDDPYVKKPLVDSVYCKDDSNCKESNGYNRSSDAQKMLKGEHDVDLSYLSIPFPMPSQTSPSSMKGAYISVDEDSSSPCLLFTFTDCDGKKTSKKYEFRRPKHWCEWHFLPIDLSNIVLCEIEGKGMWKEKNSRSFCIYSLVFLQQRIVSGKVQYIHDGYASSIPIPRDAPTFINPFFSDITATARYKGHDGDDIVSNWAKSMMMGDDPFTEFYSCISIPFKEEPPTSIKGAYICVGNLSSSNLTLLFTFNASTESEISYLYKFDRFIVDAIERRENKFWFYLTINLPDVVSCIVEGGERKGENFRVISLAFYRKETPAEEIRSSIPITRDNPFVIHPTLEVTGKDEVSCVESEHHNQSLHAQKIFKEEIYDKELLSHLSIPFPSSITEPLRMKGAYICVNKLDSSPQLLFTFTDCDGKKTSKKYEFRRPECLFEWHFLPIDLINVELCEIEGKGEWLEKNSRRFKINSLVFIKGDFCQFPHSKVFDTSETITRSKLVKCIRDQENEDELESIIWYSHVFDKDIVSNLFDSELLEMIRRIPLPDPRLYNPFVAPAIDISKQFYHLRIIAHSVQTDIPVDDIIELYRHIGFGASHNHRVLLIELPQGHIVYTSNRNSQVEKIDCYHVAESMKSNIFTLKDFQSALEDPDQFGLELLYRGIIAKYIPVNTIEYYEGEEEEEEEASSLLDPRILDLSKYGDDVCSALTLSNISNFQQEFNGKRLIDYAAYYGDLLVIRELVRHKDYNFDSVNRELSYIFDSRTTPEGIPLGASLDKDSGLTAIEFAIKSPFHDSAEVISELLQLPMDKGASDKIKTFVNKYMKSDLSLLGLAVECDKANIVKYLLFNLGVNPCQPIRRGCFKTPLARALSRENGEACANLLVSVKHDWPVGLKLDKYDWQIKLTNRIEECTKLLQGNIGEVETEEGNINLFEEMKELNCEIRNQMDLLKSYKKWRDESTKKSTIQEYNTQINFLEKDIEEMKHKLVEMKSSMERMTNRIKNKIEAKMKSKEILPTWRSLDNHSAAYVAFKAYQFNIYAFLRSNRYFPLEDERKDGSMSVESLDGFDRMFLKNSFADRSVRMDTSLVMFLLSKTRILQEDKTLFDIMRSAYEDLNEIPLIRPIIQVLEAHHGNLDIVVDFDNDNVGEVSASSAEDSIGLADYDDGRIFIAANRFHREKWDYSQMVGTIAHELTHLAMQDVFQNIYKPYSASFEIDSREDTVEEKEIESRIPEEYRIIDKIPKGLKYAIYEAFLNLYSKSEGEQRIPFHLHFPDTILGRVFRCYTADLWFREIIVRVPELLATFGQGEGKKKLINTAPKLLSWFIKHVKPKCDEYIITENKGTLYGTDALPEKQLFASSSMIHGHDYASVISSILAPLTPKDKEVASILTQQTIADREVDRDRKDSRDSYDLIQVSDIVPDELETTPSHPSSNTYHFDIALDSMRKPEYKIDFVI